MKELEGLSDVEKQKVLDEVNSLPEEETGGGNTTIVTASQDEELSKIINNMTPKEMLEQNINANFSSRMQLGKLLPQLSKKNLIRVLMATVALPETDMDLKFGGTPEDIKRAQYAFIQSQTACTSKMYVVSTEAMSRARQQKKIEDEQEESEQTNS